MSRQLHEENSRRWNPFPSYLNDYSSFNQSINEDMAEVGYTFTVNIIFAIIFLLIFSYQRLYDKVLYAPKSVEYPEKCPPLLSNENMFSWMSELWNITDDKILEKGGFDTLSFIRFYRLNTRIFATFAIFAFLVLLPVNAFGAGTDSKVDSFQEWSMTNIKQNSSLLCYHVIGMYLLTGITIYYLENEFIFYAVCRHKFLRQRRTHLRTVLVEGIPQKMRSSVTLSLYFEALYPNCVEDVHLAQDLTILESVVDERETAIRHLETLLYNYENDKRSAEIEKVETGKSRKVYRPLLHGNGKDAIKHYVDIVEKYNACVVEYQEDAKRMNKNVGKLNREESVRVIENLMRITEAGSLDHLLKESGSSLVHTSYSSSNEMSKTQSTDYGTSDLVSINGSVVSGDNSNVNKHSPLDDISITQQEIYYENFRDEFADDSEDQSDDCNSHYDNYSKLSYSEWFHEVWQCNTFSDKWERLFQGPVQKQRYDEEEFRSLVRPAEERNRFLPKAFITFKTFGAATTARQVIHMQLAGHMAVSEAPEPRDMFWKNMYLSRRSKMIRTFIVEVFVVFLIVFWVVPVTILSHITGIQYLEKIYWIKQIDEAVPFVASILKLLQPAAILGIMQLLPPLFSLLGEIQGCISFSSNQFAAFDRYFLFQVVNVFLVTTVAGSVADVFASVLQKPTSTFQLLGNSLPKMGGYFTTYIIIKACFGLGMEMIRLPARFQSLGKSIFCSNITLREQKEANWGGPKFGGLRFMNNAGGLRLAKIYAQDVLVTILCATFANISPLLLIAGVFYFFLGGLVYTYQLLYVYENEYETGGRWWPKIAKCMVLALLFAQFTMIGMILLKSSSSLSIWLAILVILTIFYLWRMTKLYEPLGEQLPFDMATSMDLDIKPDHFNESNNTDKVSDDFIQPELSPEIAMITEVTDFVVAPEDRVQIPPKNDNAA
jgi:hypothetical protein